MDRKTMGSASDDSFVHLIAGVLSSRISQRRVAVHVEIDGDADVPVPADPDAVRQLVRLLVDQAIDRMDGRGDLTITLWQNDGRWELELADTGCAVDGRPRRLPILAAQLGARLLWQNCPQGGAAVTVCFDDAAQRRAAA